MKSTQLLILLIFSTQIVAGNKNKMNELNLTEDQQAQMQIVKQTMKERLEASRIEITEQAHAEMAVFLSPEQMEQVEKRQEMRMARQDKRQEKRKNKREKRKTRRQMEKTE